MKDKVYYIKWVSSIIGLTAVIFRALNIPGYHWVDLTLSLIAVVGWLFVSFSWRDTALIMLNGTNAIILSLGILKSLFIHKL